MKDDRRWTVSLAAALMLLVTAQFAPARAQTFDPPADYPLAGESPGRTATGDLNGDGYPDIAVPTQVPGFDGYVEVLLNLGDGTFGAPAQYGVGRTPRSVAVADFGGDGDLDLAVANHDDGTVSVLMNRGDGTFDPAVDRTAGSWPFVVVAGDLDGDGFADLAVANTYEVSTLGNNGDGTFDDPRGSPFTDEIVALAIGEMEGDADLDLIVLAKRESGSWPNYDREAWVTQLWNDGYGSLNPGSGGQGGSWGYSSDWVRQPSVDSLALGDLDGNGYLDVLVGAKVGLRNLPETGPRGTFNVMFNYGQGNMSWGTPGASGLYNTQLDTGDLDNDGDSDVATGSEYVLNDGSGQFGSRQSHGGGGETVSVDDLDADGLPGLVLTLSTDTVRVMRHRSDRCPDDPDKSDPGQCGCGVPDTDTDGDGVADCIDQCPGEPDIDSDGDGTADCVDGCPDDPNKIDPGVCGCGLADVDTDGDGTLDCFDNCPNDPDKTEPGECGCGLADVDSDGDGTLDCFDDCPDDPDKTDPGLCGCGLADTDSDGDAVPDCNDLCAGFDDTLDCNANGVPDGCDMYVGTVSDEQKLVPSDGGPDHRYGTAVAVHGDAMVVGAPLDDEEGGAAGAVHVYRRVDPATGTWQREAKLTASDAAPDDAFGHAVSIYDDTIVVGAAGTYYGPGRDGVYVYRFDGDEWIEEFRQTGEGLGASVAVHGDRFVTGDSRGVYVYAYDGVWTQQGELRQWDDSPVDGYGVIDTDTIAVRCSGSACVFRYDSGTWDHTSTVTRSDGASIGNLAIHGDVIVSGSTSVDLPGGRDAGSAHVFRFDEGNGEWTEEAILTAPEIRTMDKFGSSVSIHGDAILVGESGDRAAPCDWVGQGVICTPYGSAHLFRFESVTGRWILHASVSPDDVAASDYFGHSVSIHGDTILVGSYYDDDRGSASGSAYAYRRTYSSDCDGNGTPDECEPDTDLDGVIDSCDCDLANPNCSTDCTDGDGDGYCVTTDCDDTITACNADCSDANGNGIPDCNEAGCQPGLVEDFESDSWPVAPWVEHSPSFWTETHVDATHDGVRGLRHLEQWTYRTDVSFGAYPGEVLSAWVMPGIQSTNQVYLGFGAGASGTFALRIHSHTDTIAFVDVRPYGSSDGDMTSASVDLAPGIWYLVEIENLDGTTFEARIFAEGDLVNTLATVQHEFPSLNNTGISFKGGGTGNYMDTIQIDSCSADRCPGDPNKTDPGVCGCGVADFDADADGWAGCLDCNDGNTDLWTTPGETPNLRFDLGSKNEFAWDAPAEPGAAAGTVRYDSLRSDVAGDFGAAFCIESDDGADRQALDIGVPAPGEVFHYLIRAVNDCPAGQGTLGYDSMGGERSGHGCP